MSFGSHSIGRRTPVLVGRTISTAIDLNNPVVVALNALTGGIDTTPAVGDHVLVAVAGGTTTAGNIAFSMTTSGYTKHSDLYSDDSYNSNLAFFSKKLTAAETSLTLADTNADATGVVIVEVWRHLLGLVGSVQEATGQNSAKPTPPALTPKKYGSLLVFIGAAGHGAGSATFGASDLDTLTSDKETAGSVDTTIGFGVKVWRGGTPFSAAEWTFSGTDSAFYAWAATGAVFAPLR